jgi:hypothetical protein
MLVAFSVLLSFPTFFCAHLPRYGCPRWKPLQLILLHFTLLSSFVHIDVHHSTGWTPKPLTMSAEETEQLLSPSTPDWGPARARR